jgi:hypothetical protein
MKPVLAVITSVVVLAAGWLLIGLVLSLLGYFGAQAAGRVILMHYLNLFLVWVLSPTVGGFLALRITSDIFKSVSIHTIYVGFVSVTAVLLALTYLAGLFAVTKGGSSIGDFLFSMLQGAGIFFGAWIGRSIAESHRPRVPLAE